MALDRLVILRGDASDWWEVERGWEIVHDGVEHELHAFVLQGGPGIDREDLVGDPETRVIASGVVTALLDNCCGMAVWDKINEFKPVATLDLRIDYMRPARPDHELKVTAKCYKLTRSIGFVRAFAYEVSANDPVAAAQCAFIISSPALKSQAGGVKS